MLRHTGVHLLPQETRADGLVSQAPAPTPSRISDPGMRLSVVPHGKSLYFEAGLPLNFAQSRFQGSVRLVPRVGAYALEQLPALERALIELDEAPALKQLHDQLEAVQRLASKLKLALSEQNRIEELRIRAAQKEGSILAQSVKRGGNSHGGSSAPLPDGISWNQSSRWQELARIASPLLRSYIDHANAEQQEATVAGFLRAASATNLDVHFSSERDEWLTPALGMQWNRTVPGQ